MTPLHVVHAVAVGGLLSAAALLADAGLRGRGLPTRALWVAVLAATVTAPLWGPRLSGVDPGGAPAVTTPRAATARAEAPAAATAPTAWVRLRAAAERPLPALPWLWLAAAALGVGTVGVGLVRLERRVRRWPRAVVAGEEVSVSPSFGPAVVGVRRPRTVLPAWVLGLARREVELILAHERTHRSAGDGALLAGGLLLAALCPWNPFVWVQFRRLRDGVEMDCDRRLLRGGVSLAAYARVLVLVRLRGSAVGSATAALVESSSSLERRLRTMRAFPWSGRKAVLSGALALGLVVLACETPAPSAVGPDEDAAAPSPPAAAAAEKEIPLVVRGEPSVEPLVIVDGEVATGVVMATVKRLAAENIERIEVVKGEAARGVYGERAAGGVIHITTRAGSGLVVGELRARDGAELEREVPAGYGELRLLGADEVPPAPKAMFEAQEAAPAAGGVLRPLSRLLKLATERDGGGD